MCACTYYALFKLNAFNYNKLVEGATTGTALMQVSTQGRAKRRERCTCLASHAHGGHDKCSNITANVFRNPGIY